MNPHMTSDRLHLYFHRHWGGDQGEYEPVIFKRSQQIGFINSLEELGIKNLMKDIILNVISNEGFAK